MSTLTIELFDTASKSHTEIINEQIALFNLLQVRDSEVTLNSNIILDYPASIESFLTDPINYIDTQLSNQYQKSTAEIQEIVILTTYGDKLITKLEQNGFNSSKIDMPAGPDNTYHFAKPINPTGKFIYYIEAVNEADEKIRPTFIVLAKDSEQQVIGGISGSIFTHKGNKFAYIATTVTSQIAPQGLGSQLMQDTLDYLTKSGVSKVHLGTQTADKFYLKHEFNIMNKLINNIRYRTNKHGNKIQHNLVILEKTLNYS